MIHLDRTTLAATLGPLTLVAALLGCSDSTQGPPRADTAAPTATAAPVSTATATATATAAAPNPAHKHVVVGVPYPVETIAKVVNPKSELPYTGPTGTLRGVIRVTGDAPPTLSVKLPDAPCRGEAAATHGKLFRVGQGGALADVLVAATGYKGYVPPKGEASKITIRGCSFARRTVTAAYGQRIEVANLDKVDSYMPYLDGAPTRAILVAIPGGDAVRLYPQQPGHYLIRDQLPNPHLTADVFVLAYATHDVTGLDGKYEIANLPVGPVEVNAMLPATKKASTQRIDIKEGENTLDLTITFDAKTDTPKPEGAKTDASSSAKPTPPKG